MPDTRPIERWLPIVEIGIESTCERTPMTPFPAPNRLGQAFTAEVRKRLAGAFPEEPENDTRPDGYLWARTVTCPCCDGLVPLTRTGVLPRTRPASVSPPAPAQGRARKAGSAGSRSSAPPPLSALLVRQPVRRRAAVQAAPRRPGRPRAGGPAAPVRRTGSRCCNSDIDVP